MENNLQTSLIAIMLTMLVLCMGKLNSNTRKETKLEIEKAKTELIKEIIKNK